MYAHLTACFPHLVLQNADCQVRAVQAGEHVSILATGFP